MNLSGSQRVALRAGAAILLGAAVLLAVVAILAPTGHGSSAHAVADPEHVTLPDPGVLGATAVVYGPPGRAGSSPKDLGCRLVYADGKPQSTAKLSHLMVGSAQVTVDGQRLAALFRASSYPEGSYVICQAATAPLAVSGNDPLHGLGGLVRVLAGVTAVICAGLGLTALLLLRGPPRV